MSVRLTRVYNSRVGSGIQSISQSGGASAVLTAMRRRAFVLLAVFFLAAPAGAVAQSAVPPAAAPEPSPQDRKSTRLNSSHGYISYAVFCLKKKNITHQNVQR